MLTSMLIVLPIVGALVVWAAPLPRDATASLAVLVALAEVGLWIAALAGFDFSSGVLQDSAQRTWFGDLGVSYHVGFYGFSLWLAGLTVVVGAASIGFGAWVGRDRARALLRAHALPRRGRRRRLRLPGSPPLLRLLRGDADPDLRARRGLGRPEPDRRHDHVRHLHHGRVAADARLDRRLRALAGHVQPHRLRARAGTTGSSWASSSAFAVKAPLLPFHGWLRTAYTEAPPEVAAMLSGVVSKAAVFGLIWIVLPHFPGPVDSWRTVVLVLAAVGLLYGSLLAFRQPDVRGVVAYSSMGQMSLIVLGIFAADDLGVTGAVLHSVSHGLVSAAMFLLAAMLIQRTGTDRFADLGGMARGRPALATLVLVVGMLTLAVPGSANFVGEFSILAGVFTQGWGYAAAGAAAIVLAAMYTLRLISAVLHREQGDAVRKESLDLRFGELAAARPARRDPARALRLARIDQRAPVPRVRSGLLLGDGAVIVAASIPTPEVDWLALSPSLALLAASAICLLGAVLVPRAARRPFSAVIAGAGFLTAGVLAAILFDRSPAQQQLIADSMTRDRLAALTQILVAGFGVVAVLVSWGDRRRDHIGEYYALLAAAGGGMAFFVSAGNLMTLFLGPRVVLDRALHPRRARHAPEGVAGGRPQVPRRGKPRLGDPALRLGAHVRRHGRARLRRDPRRDRSRRLPLRGRHGDDHRGPRVQGLGGPVPHVDAGRLRGRADARDRVHVGGDEGGGARRHAPRPRDGVPRAGGDLVDRDRRDRGARRS